MHLVFATSIVPCGTPETGYEIANAAMLDALARAGVRVTVLGFTWPGKAPSNPDSTVVLGSVDVTTAGAPAGQKLRWLAAAVSHGLTFGSAKLRIVSPAAVRSALDALQPIDGVILNSVQLAGAFEGVFADLPSVYVAHNVEYLSAEENAAASASLPGRLLYRREARLLKALEERLCSRARFVFTLAEEDRPLLGVADDGRSAALPLVTRAAAPARVTREPVYDAALIGTWTWQPNLIGLEWFLREVVPLLPDGFTVAVAGRAPAGLAEAHRRVEFVGRVPDATEFVRRGRVIPLISRAGTGVQLKTIETFELGLPSVATSRSVRGIAQLPGNCVIADEPRAFADALQKMSRDGRDLDGSAFHRAQRTALDRQIRRGLAVFGRVPEGAAA
ncbi:glycosyltransferase family 4 protein [Chelativorans sp.]|uniref:glycosyltransferase n=1 Tax=Chelativorans sp. TaxID=2203393 RepID=UPI0028114ED2|nr:glycosyltransferase family 4 protein [Chelativorans sp.]